MLRVRFALIFILTNSALSQDFYPLALGNSWTYGGGWTISVVGDTLMPDSKRYWRLYPTDFAEVQFVRADSAFVYVWGYNGQEGRLYSLKGNVGDTLETNYPHWYRSIITDVESTFVFGVRTKVITYTLEQLTIRRVKLAMHFGPIEIQYFEDPPAPWPESISYATSCRIGDSTYGGPLGVATTAELPRQFTVLSNYPNPFNGRTWISFVSPASGKQRVMIYSVMGQLVRSIPVESVSNATTTVIWDGEDDQATPLSSGVYIASLEAQRNIRSLRILLLK